MVRYKPNTKVIDLFLGGKTTRVVELVDVLPNFGTVDLYSVRLSSGRVVFRRLENLRPLNSFFKRLYGMGNAA